MRVLALVRLLVMRQWASLVADQRRSRKVIRSYGASDERGDDAGAGPVRAGARPGHIPVAVGLRDKSDRVRPGRSSRRRRYAQGPGNHRQQQAGSTEHKP